MAALQKVPDADPGMDRKKKGSEKLSVNTLMDCTENVSGPVFCEMPKDKLSILAEPTANDKEMETQKKIRKKNSLYTCIFSAESIDYSYARPTLGSGVCFSTFGRSNTRFSGKT